LSHYFQTGESSEVREAALADWVFTLMPFPGDAIQAACRRYIAERSRRPTPAEIVAIVREETFARGATISKNVLTEHEFGAAFFAMQKGWMSIEKAQEVILGGRSADVPPWVKTSDSRAFWAIRQAMKGKSVERQEVNER